MNNRKVVILLLATVIIVGFATTLVLLRDPSGNGVTVRIGTMGDAVDYAPYMVAKHHQWFEKEFRKLGAKNVEYTSFQELAALNEALGAKRIDVVFEAEPPAIIGRARGIDVRIVGISCSLAQEILVRSDAGIKTISDIRGKTIAVPAGTSSHYNLLKILIANGLKDSDVEIIDMSPPDAKNAFEQGEVDAWAIWPPWVEQQVISGKGTVLPKTDATIHSILSIRGDFQDEHPEISEAVYVTLERAKRWIIANPEEAQRIVANTLSLEIGVVELAWPKHDWRAQLNAEVVADIQTKADFLKETGLIRSSVNVARDLIVPFKKLAPSEQPDTPTKKAA